MTRFIVPFRKDPVAATVAYLLFAGLLVGIVGPWPWWIQNPALAGAFLLSMSFRGYQYERLTADVLKWAKTWNQAFEETFEKVAEQGKVATGWHEEHRERLNDLELVSSYGPGSLIPARAEVDALNDARIAVANRIGKRHPA